jgi:hypothetical protein
MESGLEQEIKFWQAVVASNYAIPAGYTAKDLISRLNAGLASTDPTLRDYLIYDVYTEWMYHEGTFTNDEMRAIGRQMIEHLSIGLGESDTDSVFLRTFSSLILAKVIEFDNLRKFCPPEEILEWLDRVISYFLAERDLRGYVPEKGWAHSMAHTADVLMAFALSPHLQTRELEQILNSITDRLAIQMNHINVCLEDERLSYAAVVVIQRNLIDLPFLEQWVNRTSHPIGNQRWYAGKDPLAVMSAYQNSRQFLRSLYFQLNFGIRAPSWYTDTNAFDRPARWRSECLDCLLQGIRSMDQSFFARLQAV